jgi:invasion protein IalB
MKRAGWALMAMTALAGQAEGAARTLRKDFEGWRLSCESNLKGKGWAFRPHECVVAAAVSARQDPSVRMAFGVQFRDTSHKAVQATIKVPDYPEGSYSATINLGGSTRYAPLENPNCVKGNCYFLWNMDDEHVESLKRKEPLSVEVPMTASTGRRLVFKTEGFAEAMDAMRKVTTRVGVAGR